jgi:hypothetical protein
MARNQATLLQKVKYKDTFEYENQLKNIKLSVYGLRARR